VSLNNDAVVVIDGKDLVQKIEKMIDDKFAMFEASVNGNKSTDLEEEWLRATDFCAKNKISRTTLSRYVKDKKVEVKSYTAQSKVFRWSD